MPSVGGASDGAAAAAITWLVEARGTLRVYDDGPTVMVRAARELDADRVVVAKRPVPSANPLGAVVEAVEAVRRESECQTRRNAIRLVEES